MKQRKNPTSVFAVSVAITAALSCTVVATMSATLRAQEVRPEVDSNVIYGMVSGAALLMDVYHPAVPNGIGIVWIWGSGWDAPPPYGIWHLKGRGVPPILLDAGYTVFAINHRGAPLFRYPAAVEDAQRAVRFIRHNANQYGIDPGRIGGWGGSSGGHLVGMLATLDGKGQPGHEDPVEQESSKLQAAVLRAAPTSLAEFHAGNAPDGVALVVSFTGAPTRPACRTEADFASRSWCAQAYFEGSPVRHVSPDDPPILLIHGDQDRSVPYEQAELMYAALEREGVEAKLVRIPGGNHGANDQAAMLRWLNQHLLEPDEAAALETLAAAQEQLDTGRRLAFEGDIPEAVAAYGRASDLNARLTMTAPDWNHLCWQGGLWNRADQVIHACDRAVELDPDNLEHRDSRGLVRSLLGDSNGAITDFEFFIERVQNPNRKAQRQGWVDALRAGRNPFTPELLRAMRGG